MSQEKWHIETLEMRNLCFEYDAATPVFRGLTMQLPVGENVLVTGVSGSGRSTLLKILAGLVTPTTGHYFINGQDVAEMSFEEFWPVRRQIGYSFDFGGLFNNRTLWDNMMLPLLYHGEIPYKEAEERVRLLSQKFGFYEARDRRPASVSGGARKACVVARSFVMHPEFLLMDDPFVGLDQEQVQLVVDLIATFRKQGRLKHVFFTSRDEKMAEHLNYQRLVVTPESLSMAASHVDRKVVGL